MDFRHDHPHSAPVTLERDGGHLCCPLCGLKIPYIAGRVIHVCAVPGETVRTTVPVPLEGALPCLHRSGPPQLRDCRPCVAGGRLPLVFACQIHGRCSLGTFGFRGVTSCLTCPERQPPEGADEESDE